MANKKGKGWYKKPRGHSEAAKKGWRKKRLRKTAESVFTSMAISTVFPPYAKIRLINKVTRIAMARKRGKATREFMETLFFSLAKEEFPELLNQLNLQESYEDY